MHEWFRPGLEQTGHGHLRGVGYHSLRRKFATDLKRAPLKDVMALGGWRSETMVLTYQATDLDAMRTALAHRQSTHLSTHLAVEAPAARSDRVAARAKAGRR